MRYVALLLCCYTATACLERELDIADAQRAAAPAACERMERCSTARFYEVFPSVEACVHHVSKLLDDQDRSVPAEDVEACIEWLETAECDAVGTPCLWSYR